jgi:hypothetical protein
VIEWFGMNNREDMSSSEFGMNNTEDMNSSSEKEFNLSQCTWEDYRVTCFFKKDRVLVIKRWLNRVKEDASGLTFQE